MFNKLSLLAFVAPLVSGLTLQIPENPTSGGPVTIKWTSAPGDPATFSFELVNEVFHNAFAIANNVVPEQGSLDLNLPIVPVGAGYTLQAVNIGNINDVFAETGEFAIGENAASTVTSVSASSTSRASSGSASGSSTRSATTVVSTTTRPTTTSGFGTTVTSPSPSATSAGASGSTSGAPASSSNAAASTMMSFNFNLGSIAAVALSAVAGAAFVL